MEHLLRCPSCGAVERREADSVAVTQKGTVLYSGSACGACGSMEGATDATLAVFQEPVVETELVQTRCTCRWGRIPVHVVRGTQQRVRLVLEGADLDPEEPLLTIRCRNCSGYVHITISHLGLAAQKK